MTHQPPIRLKKRADFLKLRDTEQKGIAKTMVLQARPTDPEAPLRIGFTVTKKLGNAVVRNRIKRRLREAVRLALRDTKLSGHDIVLIGRDEARTRDFKTLQGDLLYCLRKANIS